MQEYQWDSFKIHGFIIPILGYKVRISEEIPRLSHKSAYDETCRATPFVEEEQNVLEQQSFETKALRYIF